MLPTEEILAEKADAIRKLAKNVARDVAEIGRHLSEVKEHFERGDNPEFLHWAKTELGWSSRSVYRFIQVHEFLKDGIFVNLAKCELDVSVLYRLAAPSTPPEAREEIFSRAAKGQTVSVAEARDVVAHFKAPTDR
jgi:hypothetical protein